MLNYSIKQIYAVSTTFPCFWFHRLGRRMSCWWVVEVMGDFNHCNSNSIRHTIHMAILLFRAFEKNVVFLFHFYRFQVFPKRNVEIHSSRYTYYAPNTTGNFVFSNTNCIPIAAVKTSRARMFKYNFLYTMQTQFTIKYTQGYFSYISHSFEFIQD